MRASVFESFLLGVTFGMGITLLLLYTQKPICIASSLETIAENGRKRRVREKERERWRQKLEAAGFSEEEIEEIPWEARS